MRKPSHYEGAGREAHTKNLRREAITEDLSRCDWAIIRTLERLGMATKVQLERLHFHAVPEEEHGAKCRDILQRLVEHRVVATWAPSISRDSRSLSAPPYSLGTAGARLVQASAHTQVHAHQTVRTEEGDGGLVARTLAITQLFVDLVELDRAGDLSLEAFRTGSASQWPDGLGGTLSPDAFIRVARGDTTDFWWLEVDRELDSTALLLAKARVYLAFRRREETGPDGVVPRVLIGALTKTRTEALRFMLDGLPEHAREAFVVTHMPVAADVITKGLELITNSRTDSTTT